MEKEPRQEDIGRVPDPELARKMADIEAPYHKKTLSVLHPSKRKIAKGEKAAESRRLRGIEISESELPPEVLEIVKQYRAEYKDAYKDGGAWRVDKFFRIDPLVGEKVTTYKITGTVELHDKYGNWLETDDGDLVIKTDGSVVVEVDRKDFLKRCIQRLSSRNDSGGVGIDAFEF